MALLAVSLGKGTRQHFFVALLLTWMGVCADNVGVVLCVSSSFLAPVIPLNALPATAD